MKLTIKFLAMITLITINVTNAAQTKLNFFDNQTDYITYKIAGGGDPSVGPGNKLTLDWNIDTASCTAKIEKFKGEELNTAYDTFKTDKNYTATNPIPTKWDTKEKWANDYLGGNVMITQVGGQFNNSCSWKCAKMQIRNERGNTSEEKGLCASAGFNIDFGVKVSEKDSANIDGTVQFNLDFIDLEPEPTWPFGGCKYP